MKNREPVWWMPLLRRILGWGMTTAALLGLLPFFLVVAIFFSVLDFSMPISGPNPPPEPVNTIGERLFGCFAMGGLLTWPFFLLGAIIGMIAGLCAPPREPKNLFISPFFRGVLANTLGFWLLLLFVSFVVATLASIAFEPWLVRFEWELSSYGSAFVLFALSLWRAINRALSAAKLK